jgi:hypothetical protein
MSAKLMQSVSADFEQSDLRSLLEALHPDVIWKSAASEAGQRLRFGGIHVGRAGVTNRIELGAQGKVARSAIDAIQAER